MEPITVGQLKAALAGVSDDTLVKLASDSGVGQEFDYPVVVNDADYSKTMGVFYIFADYDID